MPITQAAANIGLDAIIDGKYISLHVGDPGSTGANEVANDGTSGYVRQLEAHPAAASGAKENSAAIEFPNMPACYPVGEGGQGKVTHWGVWSTATPGTGTFYWGGQLQPNADATVGKSINKGDTFRFPVSQIRFTIV